MDFMATLGKYPKNYSNAQLAFYSLSEKISDKIWSKMHRPFQGEKALKFSIAHIATMHELISTLFMKGIIHEVLKEGEPSYNEATLTSVLADLDRIKVNHI